MHKGHKLADWIEGFAERHGERIDAIPAFNTTAGAAFSMFAKEISTCLRERDTFNSVIERIAPLAVEANEAERLRKHLREFLRIETH